MSVFHNNALLGAAQPTGAVYDSTVIGNSVHLNGDDENLTKSFSGSATGTEGLYSVWVQRTANGNDDGIFATRGTIDSATKELLFSFRTDNKLEIYSFQAGGAGLVLNLKTNAVFRDTGWYHIIFSYKTSEAVTSNRAALFINGITITDFAAQTFPTLDYGLARPFASVPFGIGLSGESGSLNSDFFHGYIAQATFLDGQSIQGGDVTVSSFLDPITFGTNGSQFSAKANADVAALATTAGGNSFCLDFADSSDLGNDISDNNHDFTPNNMGSTNQTSHTPSNAHPIGSYLQLQSGAALSEGNLRVTLDNNCLHQVDIPIPSSGKYYVEATAVSGFNNQPQIIGAMVAADSVSGVTHGDVNGGATPTKGVFFVTHDGKKIIDNSESSYGSALGGISYGSGASSPNRVIQIAIDSTNGTIWFGDNGTFFNSATASEIAAGTTTNSAETGRDYSDPHFITVATTSSVTPVFDLNFGQKAFAHTPPSGYKAINSKNSPAPDHQGIDYFNTTLYEGNGGGQRVGDFVPLTETYSVSKSVIFDDASTAFLSRTPGSASNRKTYTFSTWVKRGQLGSAQTLFTAGDGTANEDTNIFFNNSGGGGFNQDCVRWNFVTGGSTAASLVTKQEVKDSSQWVNIVVAIDTRSNGNGGPASEDDRIKIYVNGVQQTGDFVQGRTNPSDNLDTFLNSTEEHRIGRSQGSVYYDGYLAETVFIDGQQLAASSFGQVDTSTNKWIPKDVSGLTFGTNGFYLDYAIAPGTGNGAGNDVSGNDNDYSESGFAATDQSNDTPTNNLPVWDGLDTVGSATPALSEGNLRFTGADNGGRVLTFPFTRGKWYWEVDVVDAGASFYIGFATPAGIAFSSATPWNNNAGSFIAAPTAGHFLGTNGSGTTNLVNNFTAYIGDGDRLAVAFDADNKFAYFGEVGSGGSGSTLTFVGQANATGDPTSGAKGTGAAPFGLNSIDNETLYHIMLAGGTDVIGQWIFDPAGFNGTPPTGYSALSQDNLDAGSSKITSWAWIKNRDANDSHMIFDRVRGVGNDLHSNDTAAQVTSGNTMQRFLQRGVQVGNDVQVNTVNESYVLWQWLIGEEASTGSTFTGGSPDIASTGIVATPGHFSVGVYSGSGNDDDDISHGLGGQIEMLMVKHFAADTDDWMIWHKGLTSNSHQLHLNTADDQDTTKNAWGSNPVFDANVFRVGATDETNKSSTGNSHVFYAFRSIPGVCKVGTYVGNGGSGDGPVLHMGFTPAWIMYKDLDEGGGWRIYDNKRDTSNVVEQGLTANTNAVEKGDQSAVQGDFLSYGWKVRNPSNTGDGGNVSGNNYLFLAMAEIAGNGTLPPIYGR